MPLDPWQVQVRDLVMGPGTPYRLSDEFNPFDLHARAAQSGPRPWGHGSWSGAEWADETVVPMPLRIKRPGTAQWTESLQALKAAFAPVGDVAEDVELRFEWGGREYVMFGRPRLVELRSHIPTNGLSYQRCAFVALDPFLYDGVETVAGPIGLPEFVGGLTVPFSVPFTINAEAVDGEVTVENEGTADAGLTLRIDGPVEMPRVTVQGPLTVETIRYNGTIPNGQFLVIDTKNRTATINGLPQASVRSSITGDWPLLPQGTSTILFRGADYNDAGTLTVTFRSAWW